MSRIMIFAGTTEGRVLCEKCIDKDIVIDVYVATQKGEELIPSSPNITVYTGRLDADEIKAEYRRLDPDMVVDATHPYAEEISRNIRLAVDKDRYVRLLRKESERVDALYADNMDKAVEIVNRSRGNVLMTTGSKDLEKYVGISDYRKRLFVRMLPENANLRKALALGIRLDHIIDETGPFTAEENIEVIEKYQIKYLVTKESGAAGGFMEKYQACKASNTVMIVVKRPEEKGCTLEQVLNMIDSIDSIKQIHIVGIGMGDPDNMTLGAIKAVEKSELIIGAKRMTDAVDTKGKAVYNEYRAIEIKKYIDSHFYRKVAVLYSGDVCLYSGAVELCQLLEGYDVRVIQGVSSAAYMASRMGIDRSQCKVISLHGRDADIVKEVRENRGLFVLTGGNTADICRELTKNGLGHVKMCIGERLSYSNERISAGYANEFTETAFDSVTTLYIENDNYGKSLEIGIDDNEFIRGNVPMTKSEVRACIISAMKLKDSYTVYDIGAGTGSVTVEMSPFVNKVYAIERTHEGCELIRQNCIKFGCGNVEIINGQAENVIDKLPKADRVFIGGSGGHIKEILDKILEKGDTHIVMTAISLETAYKALEYFNKKGFEDIGLKQIAVSRGKDTGNVTMLISENPIFIINGRMKKQ